jgi:hypothetical protein
MVSHAVMRARFGRELKTTARYRQQRRQLCKLRLKPAVKTTVVVLKKSVVYERNEPHDIA